MFIARRTDSREWRAPFKLAIGLLAILSTTASPVRAVQQDALYNASRLIMETYNSSDIDRLRGVLSEEVRGANSDGAVRRILANCKASIGTHIQRLSLPVSGTRRYGFIEAYMDHGRADMLVEVNGQGKVIFWTLSKDILARDLTCSLRDDGRRLQRQRR